MDVYIIKYGTDDPHPAKQIFKRIPSLQWENLWAITLAKRSYLASYSTWHWVSWLKWYEVQITYEVSLPKVFNRIPVQSLDPASSLQEKSGERVM